MGRKNRNHQHQQPKRIEETVVLIEEEIDSTGEVEIVEVAEYISTTGRNLSDYPVHHAHETREHHERQRQVTIDEQQAQVSTTPNEEDVQIDRYRSMHQAAPTLGKPHEMKDDELDSGINDFIAGENANGDKIPDPKAHEKAGLLQGIAARHAAFKRLIGLDSEDKTVSPVSGSQKK